MQPYAVKVARLQRVEWSRIAWCCSEQRIFGLIIRQNGEIISGIVNWSRQPDDKRDLLVYRTVLNCRNKKNREENEAAYDCAKRILKRHGFHYSEESDTGIRKAFYRGANLQRGRLKRKKGGRPQKLDIVPKRVIYDAVCEALKQHPSKNRAYRMAREQLKAYGWDSLPSKPLTESAIRSIYESYKRFAQKT